MQVKNNVERIVDYIAKLHMYIYFLTGYKTVQLTNVEMVDLATLLC